MLKNHSKCSTINQMILDLFRLEQPKGIYISYYLFKSIEKELNSISDSLKKEGSHDSEAVREFRNALDKENEGLRSNLSLMRDCIEEEAEYRIGDI